MSYNKNTPIVNTLKEETKTSVNEITTLDKDKKGSGKDQKDTDKGKKGDSKKKSKPKTSKTAARKKERDPRVRICFGVFFMLLSIFILLSFISYLINYNITGDFGQMIGMYMSKHAFGIGSLYLIILLFIGGSNLSFKGPKMKISTICKYCIMSLVWLPLLLATVLPDSLEKYYGTVGSYICDKLLAPYIKSVGIYIILVFIAFIYIIYTFDIKMPTIERDNKNKNNVDTDIDTNTDTIVDTITEDEDEDEKTDDSTDNEIETYGFNREDEDDDKFEDSGITVKHIVRTPEPEIIIEDKPESISVPVPESISKPEPILEPEPEPEPEPVVIIKTDLSDDIDMEVTLPTEEKQAKEIGEHFGLDTEFDPKLELYNFKLPPLDLLKDYGENTNSVDKEELEENKKRIVDTLANYNIAIDKIKATIGPTVTLYEIIPAAGVRISKIKGLQDDIALCLSAIGIRIIAPIPGKGTVGIEVPNQKPQIVSMKAVLGSERFQKCGYELPFGIGKTISNESYVADLAKMPHILMAGATGQGKSVGINAIISSLLYSKHPAELKFVLVDPKKVELSLYKKIERHYLAKLPDADEAIITDVRKVVRTLNSLCIEMDNRYELLKDAQVRNIKEYNAKFIARKLNPYDGHRFLPYIVLVVDEFADLIMTAGKEVEAPIARLAQLARAIGIHLIIATQRPSVNIITGSIKANFPARIAFRVISRVDSMTILDTNGADQLIGRGDMLLSTGNDLVRLQCAFIDTPEVEEITDFIGSQRGYPDAYNLPECPDEKDEGSGKENLNPDERDPLFEEAAYIIVQTQQGSTSMLQRKLKLGYNRAGRIIDQLEKAGIVGPFAGSKQREVRVANEMALEQFLKDLNMDNEDNQNYL